MTKRLLSLLLMLALLLCAAPGLGEQTPGLTAGKTNVLQKLAGENGETWREGTPPTPDMDAFQMWQWTDWFLSHQVRSLLGAIQDYEQMEPGKPLDAKAENDQWRLRELENTLSRFEAQLEEGRLAILNGIGLCQMEETSDGEREELIDRILEAESEIRQIISTICSEYKTYVALVEACGGRLQENYGGYTSGVQSSRYDSLVQEAREREADENAANAGFYVSVSSTAQFKIQVVGPNQSLIKNARVTVTNQRKTSKTKTVTTDANGHAVFWVSDLGADEKEDLRLKLRIEADGYRTQEVQTVRLRSGETKSIYMHKDDGSPYLVMGCFNGNDILTEARTYYCTKKNTLNHAISAKVHCDKAGELELRYSVDAKATEFKTVVKPFTAEDSDKTVFKFEDQWLGKLLPGAKVSLTIRSGGKTYTTELRLDIQKAMVDEPFFSKSALFSFTSGTSGLSFTIPGKVPFISGSRLAIDIPGKLPQVVYTPSHMVMFAWGYDFRPEQANWKSEDAEDQANAIKTFQAKSKADKALAMAGTYRNVNTTTKWKFLGNYGASVTPFASAQGLYRTSDRSLELRGAGGATLAFKAEATQTFTVGPVPFFVGVDFSMGVSFGLDITMAMKMDVIGGEPKVVKGPEIGYGSGLTVSMRLEMGVTGGVGLKKVASIGIRFYGYLNPIVHFTTPKVTADAKLGMGFEVTIRMLFLKWNATIWKGELSLAENAASPTTSTLVRSIPNNTQVEPLSTINLLSQIDIAADDPQFVQIGSDTYLFWIQPGADSNHPTRLNWQNLSNTNHSGVITHLNGQSQDLRRNSYMDYAFALEAAEDYCALTILSGKFSSSGSVDTPAPPSNACVATVLIKRNDGTSDSQKTGNLHIIGYQEGPFFDQDSDYPIMPEARLLKSGNDIRILSACSTANAPEKIDSRLYAYAPNFENTTGKNLKLEWSLPCVDAAEITRYRIADASVTGPQQFYTLSRASLTADVQGALSRLTVRSGNACTREVLAQGNIIHFTVLPGSSPSADRLFYLEQVINEGGDAVQRLRSVTTDPQLKRTDYDIETGAAFFDIVYFGDGIYLYWTECADDSPDTSEEDRKYLVRCVRYDPGTDTVVGPFSLVELGESPGVIKLQSSTTGTPADGYYAVNLQNASGSYQRCSVSQFSYALIRSLELTSAVLLDPCVSAGDFADLSFSVRNTGSVPISAIDVAIVDTAVNGAGATVQTLHMDLDHPEDSAIHYQSQNTGFTMTGAHVLRRLGNMYDPMSQEDWTITDTTAAGEQKRSVRTGLLMPGDSRSYQIKMQIPADWQGGNTLEAQITEVTGEASLTSRQDAQGQRLMGTSRTRNAAQNNLTLRLNSATASKKIDTNAHDLMLSAQRFERQGEEYVHITIRNRSGNTASSVTPVLTSVFRGKTLFRHEFVRTMGDGFGYALDIPLTTLTANRLLPELDLYVASRGHSAEDFADSDNHVRLLLTTLLCIVEQPVSIPATEGDEATFFVTAAGGVTPYRYQWQRMTGVDRWENIPGATQEVYRIASVAGEQNGLTVRCVVTDQFGDSVISDPATLSILPRTGDSTRMTLWLLLALASVAALVMVCRRRRDS